MLYCEDVSNCGQWCIVVLEPWRQELLTKNHSTIYAGHLSEKKFMIVFVGCTGDLV